MSFQIACKYCGQISQSELPIVKKDGVLQLTCTSCDATLFYIYGPESPFTKLMKEINNDN